MGSKIIKILLICFLPIMAIAQTPGVGVNKIDSTLNIQIGTSIVKFKSMPYYLTAFGTKEPSFSILPVSKGGTGRNSVTVGALVKGNATGAFIDAVPNTDYATPASVQAVTVTPVQVSGTSQTMSANTLYVPVNTSLTTFTLPATATFGQRFQVIGEGSGGWRISQNNGQQIVGVNVATTSGTAGYVSSTNSNCTITLIAVSATRWKITSSQGTISIN